MSQLGQNRKSSMRANVFRCHPTDIAKILWHVRFVPTAEVARSLNHFVGAETGQPAKPGSLARRRDKGQIGNLSRHLLKEYPPMLLCEPSLSSLVALAVAEALTIGAPDAEVELLDVLVLAPGFGVAVHHYAAVFQNIAVSCKS